MTAHGHGPLLGQPTVAPARGVPVPGLDPVALHAVRLGHGQQVLAGRVPLDSPAGPAKLVTQPLGVHDLAHALGVGVPDEVPGGGRLGGRSGGRGARHCQGFAPLFGGMGHGPSSCVPFARSERCPLTVSPALRSARAVNR